MVLLPSSWASSSLIGGKFDGSPLCCNDYHKVTKADTWFTLHRAWISVQAEPHPLQHEQVMLERVGGG